MAAGHRTERGARFADIKPCTARIASKFDRLELLRRLGGESILEGLDAVQAEYAAFQARPSSQAPFPLAPPATPLPVKQLVNNDEDDGDDVGGPSDPCTSSHPMPSGPIIPGDGRQADPESWSRARLGGRCSSLAFPRKQAR